MPKPLDCEHESGKDDYDNGEAGRPSSGGRVSRLDDHGDSDEQQLESSDGVSAMTPAPSRAGNCQIPDGQRSARNSVITTTATDPSTKIIKSTPIPAIAAVNSQLRSRSSETVAKPAQNIRLG